MKKRQKIIVIVGPTASGKTAAAIRIAKKIGGEIISADSRAVYKGLTIGANIPSLKERAGVPHYLFEILSPKKVFTVSDFVLQADTLIADIAARGKTPIIAGGTGLYVDALLRRVQVPEVPPNPKLRKILEKKSVQELYRTLKKLDPRRAKSIEKENPRRLIRAIEIAKAIGKSPAGITPKEPSPYEAVMIGIAPSEKILHKKITDRAKIQARRGLVAETKRIKNRYNLSWKRLDELGFEYRLSGTVIRGELPRQELASQLASANIRYAKRQIRYLKRNPQIRWQMDLTKANIYDLLYSV